MIRTLRERDALIKKEHEPKRCVDNRVLSLSRRESSSHVRRVPVPPGDIVATDGGVMVIARARAAEVFTAQERVVKSSLYAHIDKTEIDRISGQEVGRS
jgi:hypothetical protein